MSSLTQKAIKVIDGLLQLSSSELLKKINNHQPVGFDKILESSRMFDLDEDLENDLKLLLNRIYFNRIKY